MRLSLCKALTRETRPDHNTGNYVPYRCQLLFADEGKNSWRKVKEPSKVEINLDTRKHEEYYYYYSRFRACQIWLPLIRS